MNVGYLMNDYPEVAKQLTTELNDWLDNGMNEAFKKSDEKK